MSGEWWVSKSENFCNTKDSLVLCIDARCSAEEDWDAGKKKREVILIVSMSARSTEVSVTFFVL